MSVKVVDISLAASRLGQYPSLFTSTKEVLYEVRCLKSTEDMILALAGQFMQLSHEPEKFSGSTGFEPMTSVICANRINMMV